MVKPLFSTICTTCHARIAVLKEEAIGTILGCPKCGGMVLISPPEGWVSGHAAEVPAGAGAAVVPRGPPPLGKVSQTFLTLDLDAEATVGGWQSLLARCVQSKIVWAGTAASILLVGVLTWIWVAASPAKVEIAVATVDRTKKVEKAERTASSQPVARIAEKHEPPPPTAAKPAETAEIRPAEVRPAETKVTETKPPEIKTEAKAVDAPAVAANPVEAKPVEPTRVEAAPAETKLAAAHEDSPRIADARGAGPALPSVADVAPEVAIRPLPAEKPAALPITAAKLVKQAAPPEIEVESRLDDVIPGLELKDVPFTRALAVVSSITTLPITLDADALRRDGISPRDLVSISVKDATVEKLLEDLASRRGLGVEVEKGQVIITAPAEQTETLRTVSYTVADLCVGGATADNLAELIEKFVSPDTWQTRGGQGTIKAESGSLAIAQTGAVHAEIVIFCEKLRLARGLSLRSTLDPKRLQLTSAYLQAKPMLEKQVSANYHEATTLGQVLDNLGARAGVDILLDRRALAAAGMSDKMEISYTVVKQPLEAALDGLLRPLSLGYRAIDAHTLQVAPQKDLDHRLAWEIYPVGKLLGTEFSGRDLLVRLKQSVAPASWTNRGLIVFDSPSKALLISASPVVQAAVSRYLSETPNK